MRNIQHPRCFSQRPAYPPRLNLLRPSPISFRLALWNPSVSDRFSRYRQWAELGCPVRITVIDNASLTAGSELLMSRVRCVQCGSAQFDPQAYKCGKCGGAMAVRSEQCYVSEKTIRKLRSHPNELSRFGITIEQREPLRKDWIGTAVGVTALALYVADRVQPDATRNLIQFLCDLAVPKDDILKLRIGEPEEILTYIEMDRRNVSRAIRQPRRPATVRNIPRRANPRRKDGRSRARRKSVK